MSPNFIGKLFENLNSAMSSPPKERLTVIVQLVCDITFIFVNNLTFSFLKKKRGAVEKRKTFSLPCF